MRSLLCAFVASALAAADAPRLPDGSGFPSWERPVRFTKTYYVDGSSPRADDHGPGSRERPFRTINPAARILEPGERVVIASGVYRECVRPKRGGAGPDRMITYEAAPGATVVIRGSAVLKGVWTPSSGWRVNGDPKIYQIRLGGQLFSEGYNPFGMVNVLQDRYWLDYKTIDMAPYFRRRGMVFVEGKPLEPVDQYRQLGGDKNIRPVSAFDNRVAGNLFDEMGGGGGRFWVEHNGLTLHVRLADDSNPNGRGVEITTQEQVFAPLDRHLGYIRVKGIVFQHAGNGFPVPQRGMVSTNRGHHWIIEGNTLEWANSVALDIGKEDWNAVTPEICGHHIVRGNTIRYAGICGVAGPATRDVRMEDNLIEHVGWQDAEQMWESAAVKLHEAVNLLFWNNVVRHIRHANGIWLDVGNSNCRVTRNVFADVTTQTAAIHIEGSHERNQLDNNIIAGVRRAKPGINRGGSGIYIQGTDKTVIAHNLIADCEGSGVYTTTEHNRIIRMRGGTARGNKVYNNILHNCQKDAIEFANVHNEAEGNFYSALRGGYLRVMAPEPPELLDIEAWREFHGWDRSGRAGALDLSFNIQTLELRMPLIQGEWPGVPRVSGVATAFGVAEGATTYPGPFADPANTELVGLKAGRK